MSVIKAGTTLTTAYTVEADTTGALEFKTGPSATLAMSISASGVVTFPATTGFDIASANITNLTSGTTSATVLRSASGTITNLLATTATVSASAFFATASGSVGIGLSNPTYKLEVQDTAPRVTLRATTNGSNVGYRLEAKDSGGTNRTSGYYFQPQTGTNESYLGLSADDSGYQLGVKANGNVFLLGGATNVSGVGITFPATQSASSNANCLDDYEEGSWTPTFFGESTAGTTTYGVQRGGYIKIGSMVTVWCDVSVSAATGTGNVQIGGLPFTSISDVNFQSVAPLMVENLDWGAGTYLQAYLYGSTNIRVYYMTDNASWAQQQVNNESQEYIFTMNYRVA
jgi:hypothetical protein